MDGPSTLSPPLLSRTTPLGLPLPPTLRRSSAELTRFACKPRPWGWAFLFLLCSSIVNFPVVSLTFSFFCLHSDYPFLLLLGKLLWPTTGFSRWELGPGAFISGFKSNHNMFSNIPWYGLDTNYIAEPGPLMKFAFSHQSDVSLSILSSDHHQISTEGERGGTQYLLIEVVPRSGTRIKHPCSRWRTGDQMCLRSRSDWTPSSIKTCRIRWVDMVGRKWPAIVNCRYQER